MHVSKLYPVPKAERRITDMRLTGNFRWRFSKWLRRPLLQLEWTWQVRVDSKPWSPVDAPARFTVETRTAWRYSTLSNLEEFVHWKGTDVFSVDPVGEFTGKRKHRWWRGPDRVELMVERSRLGIKPSYWLAGASWTIRRKWIKAKPVDIYPDLIAK